jgi:hypothetical protein
VSADPRRHPVAPGGGTAAAAAPLTGHSIAITAHDPHVATRLAEALVALGGRVAAPGEPLDLAVVVGPRPVPSRAAELPADDLLAAIEEALAFDLRAITALLDRVGDGGAIVVTLSAAGFLPGPAGTAAAVVDHARRGLVQQLAWELAPRVRVNGVAIPTETDPVPLAEVYALVGSRTAGRVVTATIHECHGALPGPGRRDHEAVRR